MMYKNRIQWFFSQIWYWIRTHTYNRYHIINLKNKKNGYAWGYIEPCEAILFACFNQLDRYMKYQFEQIDWDWCKERRSIGKEFKELHEWWSKGRAEEQKKENEWSEKLPWPMHTGDGLHNLMEDSYKEYFDFITYRETKEQEMLERLIKIREYMWS